MRFESELNTLIRQIVDYGEQMGLPYIAASSDVSDPSPMMDETGRPLAETVFKWFDPEFEYWNDRTFALRSGFVQAARICAEPFYFDGHTLTSWRTNNALDLFNKHADYNAYGVKNAIICPCHLPFGVLGTVVWATNKSLDNIEQIFEQKAGELAMVTLRFLSVAREHDISPRPPEVTGLTRREIQCLKWAALGKTDNEIATIMRLSIPTIRFHLVNAGKKFGVYGRAQAVRVATSLGFIGGNRS